MAAKNASSLAFGRAMKAVRVGRGLSQEEAGLTCGIGRTQFGRLERGEASPTYDTVIEIAHGLEMSPVDLIAIVEGFRVGEDADEAGPAGSVS